MRKNTPKSQLYGGDIESAKICVMKWSSDEDRLLTGDINGNVMLWDIRASNVINSYKFSNVKL
jgi:WD40 repeat protein